MGSIAIREATATDPVGPVANVGYKTARPRLDSLDLLRGLVMVIMALDHTRDYFSHSFFINPRSIQPTLAKRRWRCF